MGELTPERLAELRRIAEAATPGPWTSPWDQKDGLDPEECGFYGASGEKIVGLFWYNGWYLECSEKNVRHIATFDPTTVLALLDEIERLRREREVLAAGLIDSEECVKVLLDLFPDDVRAGIAGVVDRMGRRRRTALALLDGEKGGAIS